MFIAGIAGIAAPLGLLLGFYGMNVQEFTPGASVSLFDFWQTGIPIFLATSVLFFSPWSMDDDELCESMLDAAWILGKVKAA